MMRQCEAITKTGTRCLNKSKKLNVILIRDRMGGVCGSHIRLLTNHGNIKLTPTIINSPKPTDAQVEKLTEKINILTVTQGTIDVNKCYIHKIPNEIYNLILSKYLDAESKFYFSLTCRFAREEFFRYSTLHLRNIFLSAGFECSNNEQINIRINDHITKNKDPNLYQRVKFDRYYSNVIEIRSWKTFSRVIIHNISDSFKTIFRKNKKPQIVQEFITLFNREAIKYQLILLSHYPFDTYYLNKHQMMLEESV